MGDALALGRGARARTERDETNVLADAVEALVAAVYGALGLEGARALVDDIVGEGMANPEALDSRDPEGLLQERMQARGLGTPAYRVTGMRGSPPDQLFDVEVVVKPGEPDEQVMGCGEGRLKRFPAEKAAATAAIGMTTRDAGRSLTSGGDGGHRDDVDAGAHPGGGGAFGITTL